MKRYPDELHIYNDSVKGMPLNLAISNEQFLDIKTRIQKIRTIGRDRPYLHLLLAISPFVVLIVCWVILYFFVTPSLVATEKPLITIFIFSLIRGFIGYSWVIYGLHEGAGHGLLKGTIFQYFTFHSSRILFADPEYYQTVHRSHHQYLGTDKDEAFTHYILNSRILKSILPGSGILFPNDYKIHQGDKYSKSRFLSDTCGFLFLVLELSILKSIGFGLINGFIALAVISPWIGFSLDRIRESIEHHLMPQDKFQGSRELGLNISGFFIGGGPWGQALHFSHHLAPDLNWYQQYLLHKELQVVLNRDQQQRLGFATKNWFLYFIKVIKDNFHRERNYHEIH